MYNSTGFTSTLGGEDKPSIFYYSGQIVYIAPTAKPIGSFKKGALFSMHDIIAED